MPFISENGCRFLQPIQIDYAIKLRGFEDTGVIMTKCPSQKFWEDVLQLGISGGII